MRILALVARGVRNLAPLTLVPRARFNVFVGDNGQGKTNLLEAIFAVAALRSFRTSKLSDLIAFGEPQAELGARVAKDELTRVYEVEILPGSRRVKLDGKAARPLARYFGGFNVVVFTPEDLGLARGAPADRRRFLDRGVFNLRPGYLATSSDYDKVLKQRNSVLRQVGQGALSAARAEDLLQIYDQQLAALGVALAHDRGRFLDVIRPALLDAFAAITRTGHVAGARYASLAAAGTAADLEAKLREGRARDLATGSTHVGPHRDDSRARARWARRGELRLAGAAARAHARVEERRARRALSRARRCADLAARRRVVGARPVAQRISLPTPRRTGRSVLHHDHARESCSPRCGTCGLPHRIRPYRRVKTRVMWYA